MTLFEELNRAYEAAHQKKSKYENDCIDLAAKVTGKLRDILGIKKEDGAFTRAHFDERSLPGGAKLAPGGWFDAEGKYYFVVRLLVGGLTIDKRCAVYRQDGSFRIETKQEKPIAADDLDEACAMIADELVEAMRAHITKSSFSTRWE